MSSPGYLANLQLAPDSRGCSVNHPINLSQTGCICDPGCGLGPRNNGKLRKLTRRDGAMRKGGRAAMNSQGHLKFNSVTLEVPKW